MIRRLLYWWKHDFNGRCPVCGHPRTVWMDDTWYCMNYRCADFNKEPHRRQKQDKSK